MRIVSAIWAKLSEVCRDVVIAKVATVSQNELLAGRSALITGGTSGIGYLIARAFLFSGANVVITGRDAVRRLVRICGEGNFLAAASARPVCHAGGDCETWRYSLFVRCAGLSWATWFS